jgi:hypothetical protein
MEHEQLPDDIDMEGLLKKLDLVEGGAPTITSYFVAPLIFSPLTPTDVARHKRILEKAQSWIEFLEGQAGALTETASRLADQLVASGVMVSLDASQDSTDDGGMAGVVNRLEWTLTALESWIEERQPSSATRLRIRWIDWDGLVSWVAEKQDRTDPTSLEEIVRDGAEVEGEFSPEAAESIARLIVAGLRSGEVQLTRLRQLPHETTSNESIFELVPRGVAYEAVAQTEGCLLAPEIEAQLGNDLTSQLAALVDDARYARAQEARTATADEPGLTRDIVDGVNGIARRCGIPASEMARCLTSLVGQRLDDALRRDDYVASVRLARAISALMRVGPAEP